MTTETLTTASVSPWTCPAGVSVVRVQMWGAGGRSSNASNAAPCAGAGSGGGAYAELTAYSVTPGATYAFVVGAGGTATTGVAGKSNWVSDLVGVAVGGANRANNSQVGGAGGLVANCVGDVKYAGGNGGDTVAGVSGGGGGGAAGPTGAGGNASTFTGGTGNSPGATGKDGQVISADGTAGSAPGGGAGGACRLAGGTTGAGTGGDGQIILTYTAVTATQLLAGELVSDDGQLQTTFLADDSAVPAGVPYLNGVAHKSTGERYVCGWPTIQGANYLAGRAIRDDGAQIIATSGTGSNVIGGFRYSNRGELYVAAAGTPAQMVRGLAVDSSGNLCVSAAS